MRTSTHVFVYISGTGLTLQAIINGCKVAKPSFVYSSNPEAGGLRYAIDANILTKCAMGDDVLDDFCDMMLRVGYPRLIILAGYMKILPPHFIEFMDNNDVQIINIHPSLLPKHKGLNTHQRVIDAGDTEHGFTIHEVTAELDSGPIIHQHAFVIDDDDTAEDLQNAVKLREQSIYPKIIDEIMSK